MSKLPPSVRKYLSNQLKKARAAKKAKAKQPKAPRAQKNDLTSIKVAANALKMALERLV